MLKEIRTCRCGQQYTILFVHDSNETPKRRLSRYYINISHEILSTRTLKQKMEFNRLRMKLYDIQPTLLIRSGPITLATTSYICML